MIVHMRWLPLVPAVLCLQACTPQEKGDLVLRNIALVLLAAWLLLVLIGKGGFVHLLLLNGIVIYLIDAVSIYRSKMTQS